MRYATASANNKRAMRLNADCADFVEGVGRLVYLVRSALCGATKRFALVVRLQKCSSEQKARYEERALLSDLLLCYLAWLK